MDQFDHYYPAHQKIKLVEINGLITCHLCKGYLIDATAISECLHTFCRSCIIKFLEETSYCPICEVLINKAKPNLKEDKTLQDIVYKLVPELFVEEMKRRKYFFLKYPELAHKVSPEQRGEDTERTIFNAKDEISLSIEYISNDSTPGAINVRCIKNGMEASTNESPEAQMKRYLQCPGKCRVDVLKKFVENKYQVDTTLFYIDILYKRVPLPNHYTLIDIAYIYSWKRNEPMKFYFRITDINKVTERFDYFDSTKPVAEIFKPPARVRNHHPDRERTPRVSKKSLGRSKRSGANKPCSSQNSPRTPHNKNKNKILKEDTTVEPTPIEEIINEKTEAIPESQNSDPKSEAQKKNKENIANNEDEYKKSETKSDSTVGNKKDDESDTQSHVYRNITLNRTNNSEIITEIQKVSNKEGQPLVLNIIKQSVKVPNSTNDVDNNNTNDLDKDNNKVVPKLIIRTDADKKLVVSDSKIQNNTSPGRYKKLQPKDEKKPNNKTEKPVPSTEKKTERSSKENPIKIIISESDVRKKTGENKAKKIDVNKSRPSTSRKVDVLQQENDLEKSEFFRSINLTARSPIAEQSGFRSNKMPPPNAEVPKGKMAVPFGLVSGKIIAPTSEVPKRKIPSSVGLGSNQMVSQTSKRKNSSPTKSDKPAKKQKLTKRPATKIILQSKTPVPTPLVASMMSNVNQNANSVSKIVEQTNPKPGNPDLQSLFDSCKINIPSSLSITLKEGNDSEVNNPVLIPPVKNYIQILKLPDEETGKKRGTSPESSDNSGVSRPEFFSKDNNTLIVQKIMSDPKSEKAQTILPSPVPDLPCKLFNIPKDGPGKLSPRSPQTFQKIFEESIKKQPDGKTPVTKEKVTVTIAGASDNSILGKRKINDIASQLHMKSLLESDKHDEISISKAEEKIEKFPSTSSGKIAIPRISNQKISKVVKKPKFELLSNNCGPQSYANLHSNALGLDYTVSISQSSPVPTGSNNGLLASSKTVKFDDKAKITSSTINLGSSKPREENTVRHMPNLDPEPNKNGQFQRMDTSDVKINDDGAVSSAIDCTKSDSTPSKTATPNSSPELIIASPADSKQQSFKIESNKSVAHPGSGRNSSPRLSSSSSRLSSNSPMLGANSPMLGANSPRLGSNSPRLNTNSPRLGANSPRLASPRSAVSPKSPASSSKASPQIKPASSSNAPLNSNQILEQYNIQNLAQLTASFNFNPANMALGQNSHIAALQQAVFLKQIEMQNRQNWLNMNQHHLHNINQIPLLQFENYMKSLNQAHLLGKEN